MDFKSNYDWRFVEGYKESYLKDGLPETARRVDLPHYGVKTPRHYFDSSVYQKVFCYEKRFEVFLAKGESLFLRMEGAFQKTRAYLNGLFVKEEITSYFPTVFDLTPFAQDGENRLLLVVDSREDKAIPPFGNVVDYMTFAGIYRPLELQIKKESFIEKAFFRGKADGTYHIDASVKGEGELFFSLSKNGLPIRDFKEKEGRISDIDPWDIDNPVLYSLKASLRKDGVLLDEKKMQIGFRDIEWKRDGFYLNGKKRKLLGLNRHQNYPFIGASATKSLQELDADILKREIGVDVVRTSHYPQSEDFLSRADEIGLLVIDEVPGWQYVSKDEKWRQVFLSFIERMVLKERNHPSLIAYGVRIDESEDDDELYSKANEIAHRLDPSRKTLGVRNFKKSSLLEDIYAYNDFSGGDVQHGLTNPKTITKAKAPLLISEFAGHMFPTKAFDNPSRREEQALRHLKVMDDFYKHPNLSMAIGWCAFDYNTHKEFGSGDAICYHGVNDIYRNPKEASFAYKSQKEEGTVLEVLGSFITGDNDEALMKPLYVLTNCDFLSLYANDAFIGRFYPNAEAYPHLPHPPICIDDWIGESFKEGLSKGNSKRVVSLLNAIASKGVAHLGIGDYLRFASIALRTGLKVKNITSLYYKYVTSWGKEARIYRLEGYKNGKKVIEKRLSLSTSWHIEASFSKETLENKETYDTLMVRLLAKDENGSILPYFDEVASLSLEGPLEALSPTRLAFSGGRLSFLIRSKDTKENALGHIRIEIEKEVLKKDIEVLSYHLL